MMDSLSGSALNMTGDSTEDSQRYGRISSNSGRNSDLFQKEIVKVLADAADFIPVPQIHWRLEKRGVKSSVGAVYRNVKRLEERGVLEQRRFQGRKGVFALAQKSAPRDHLILVDTGEVESLQGETLNRSSKNATPFYIIYIMRSNGSATFLSIAHGSVLHPAASVFKYLVRLASFAILFPVTAQCF